MKLSTMGLLASALSSALASPNWGGGGGGGGGEGGFWFGSGWGDECWVCALFLFLPLLVPFGTSQFSRRQIHRSLPAHPTTIRQKPPPNTSQQDSCFSSAFPSPTSTTAGSWPYSSSLSSLCATPTPFLSSCLSASCTGTRTYDDAWATSLCSSYTSCTSASPLPTECSWFGSSGLGFWGGGGGGGGGTGPWAGWGTRDPGGWYTVTGSGTCTGGWTTRTETITTTTTRGAGAGAGSTLGAKVTQTWTETRTGTVVAAAVLAAETAVVGQASTGGTEGGKVDERVLVMAGLLAVGVAVVGML